MPMTLEEIRTKHEEFQRLLLKTPLEKYTQQLWDVFKAAASDEFDFESRIEASEKRIRERCKKDIEVAKQLFAILKDEPVKIGKTRVTSTKAVESLKANLMDEYKALRLNYRQMTLEEAECYLDNWRHDEEAKRWIIEESEKYYETPICDEEIDGFIQDYPEICQEFADLCEIKEDIMTEKIADKIEELTKTISSLSRVGKKGRPVKNLNLIWVILRIREYHKEDRSKDLRLIFDCMNMFGLLDDVIIDWPKKYGTGREYKYAEAHYIKSIYQAARNYEAHCNFIKATHRILGVEYDKTL